MGDDSVLIHTGVVCCRDSLKENFVSKILIHSLFTHSFHAWGPETLETEGLGGSETNCIETTSRLSERGYEAEAYVDNLVGGPRYFKGALWSRDIGSDHIQQPGIWIIHRDGSNLDRFTKNHSQKLWLICHDFVPLFGMNPHRGDKLHRVICLSTKHAEFFAEEYPYLAKKIHICSNGIRVEAMEKVEKAFTGKRNQKKIIYASSPDRGLLRAIDVFVRVREEEPEAELHVCYGTRGMRDLLVLAKEGKEHMATGWYDGHVKLLNEIEHKLKTTTGLVNHGSLKQEDLWQQYLESEVWLYPTSFQETNCITALEAQALGAIPSVNPSWGLEDTAMWGDLIPIADNRWNRISLNAYKDSVLARISGDRPWWYENTRNYMKQWARSRFSWGKIVDKWELWIKEDIEQLEGSGESNVECEGNGCKAGCSVCDVTCSEAVGA